MATHAAYAKTLEADDGDRLERDEKWKKHHKVKATDFLTARRGDHMMVAFQCDCCVFRRLRGHEPDEDNSSDSLLLTCIRRVNLDSFWSRATTTAQKVAGTAKRMITHAEVLGLDGPFLSPGPLPNYDHCGYQVACLMVLASLEEGRYSKDHLQWDTIRKFRSVFSNQVRASGIVNGKNWVLGDLDGKIYNRLSIDPCGSLWFSRFNEGCRKRMGQDWRPDQAISTELMKELLGQLYSQVLIEKNLDRKFTLILAGTYFALMLRSLAQRT